MKHENSNTETSSKHAITFSKSSHVHIVKTTISLLCQQTSDPMPAAAVEAGNLQTGDRSIKRAHKVYLTFCLRKNMCVYKYAHYVLYIDFRPSPGGAAAPQTPGLILGGSRRSDSPAVGLPLRNPPAKINIKYRGQLRTETG